MTYEGGSALSGNYLKKIQHKTTGHKETCNLGKSYRFYKRSQNIYLFVVIPDAESADY